MKKHFRSLTNLVSFSYNVHIPPPDLIYRLNPNRIFFKKKQILEVKSPAHEKVRDFPLIFNSNSRNAV